jgi:hypothetical protein
MAFLPILLATSLPDVRQQCQQQWQRYQQPRIWNGCMPAPLRAHRCHHRRPGGTPLPRPAQQLPSRELILAWLVSRSSC